MTPVFTARSALPRYQDSTHNIQVINHIFQVGAKSFIIPNDKDIYCVTCFEDRIATKCTKCKQVLTTGGVT